MDGGGSRGFQPASTDPPPRPTTPPAGPSDQPRPPEPAPRREPPPRPRPSARRPSHPTRVDAPPAPPRPRRPSGTPEPPHDDHPGSALLTWVHTPRPVDVPGVYRFGHVPRPPEEPDRLPTRRLLFSAVLSALLGWVVWRLLWIDFIPVWKFTALIVPRTWRDEPLLWDSLHWALVVGVVLAVAHFGQWPELARRLVARARPAQDGSPAAPRPGPRRPAPAVAGPPTVTLLVRGAAATVAGWLVWWLMWFDVIPVWTLLTAVSPDDWEDGDLLWGSYALLLQVVVVGGVLYCARADLLYRRFVEPRVPLVVLALPGVRRFTTPELFPRPDSAPPRPAPRQAHGSAWPALREAGATELADRLDGEVRAGELNDVDYVRLVRAWRNADGDPGRTRTFTETVLRHGGAAFTHPSGARTLPARNGTRHDLLGPQLRLGTAVDDEKNPWAYRTTAIALDPTLLGTSLVAVGPPGSGKTSAVLRPVVESLNLQALCGLAAVVAVGPADADLGPDDAFDVVISLGDPTSRYDLDLYGGTAEPDEAAGCLAEALLPEGETDSRPARIALRQVLGPFHAGHGRFPSVGELRELLDGTPESFAALRETLHGTDASGYVRDLAARQRLHGRPDDVGPALANRLALLGRPAFATFFDVSGTGRPFSLRALEYPLRVRIGLPSRGHAEASRILARLVLAQFAAAVAARADRSLFACLVLDDATQVATADLVREVQRLRSGNAGVVLALRSLDDVAEGLRDALLGAVGCHLALSGVNTWDGGHFAEAWGKVWVDDPTVTRSPDHYGGSFRRNMNTLRRVVTGRAVTLESVTVRKVERERWSASELANAVPPGHAVVALATTEGERLPPLLVNLHG